ncbi:MAG: hypothetical protein IPK09_03025 [Candidatus Competibacteraceae bacterium]|nr:hypothetical protein [Candidatus Competibacteraceae bacterium]
MTDRDDELHDGTIAALYRQTRQAEPPEWLDRRVLMAAESAVGSRPARPSKLRRNHWVVPLALAATVVLTTGVVRMVRESGEFAMSVRLEHAELADKPPAAAEENSTAVGNVASPAAKFARPDGLAVPATPARPVVSAEAPPAPPAATLPEVIGGRAKLSSPPAATAYPSLQAVPAKPAEREERAPAVEELKKDEESRARKPAPAVERTNSRDQLSHRPPEEWLKEIAELRRQGRTVEAEAKLAEFRRRYPDYPPDAESAPR